MVNLTTDSLVLLGALGVMVFAAAYVAFALIARYRERRRARRLWSNYFRG